MSRIRVLLADDHQPMIEKIREVLAPYVEVVGAVENGALLIEAAGALDPDVIVVDVAMPVMNGIRAADQLKHCGSRAKLVFLTIHDDPLLARTCLSVGGAAYVLKTRITQDLIGAIDEALADRTFVSPFPPQLSESAANGGWGHK